MTSIKSALEDARPREFYIIANSPTGVTVGTHPESGGLRVIEYSAYEAMQERAEDCENALANVRENLDIISTEKERLLNVERAKSQRLRELLREIVNDTPGPNFEFTDSMAIDLINKARKALAEDCREK